METPGLTNDLLSLPLLPGGIEKRGHITGDPGACLWYSGGGGWEKSPPKKNQLKEACKFFWQGCAGAICGLLKVCLILVTLLYLEETHCHKFLLLIEGLYLYPGKMRIRKLYFHTLREQSIWPITQSNSKSKNDCAFHLIPISTWKVCHGSTPINTPMRMKAKITYKEKKKYIYT